MLAVVGTRGTLNQTKQGITMKVYEVTFMIETDEDLNDDDDSVGLQAAAHAAGEDLVKQIYWLSSVYHAEVWSGQTTVKRVTRYSPTYLKRLKADKC